MTITSVSTVKMKRNGGGGGGGGVDFLAWSHVEEYNQFWGSTFFY